jgi:small subunit ribosomal protein S1
METLSKVTPSAVADPAPRQMKAHSGDSTTRMGKKDVSQSRIVQKHKETTAYGIGEVIEGRISGVHDYGCFVRLPNGESGLVFKEQICWPGENISVVLGDEVVVRVLSFKPGRGLALSMREVRTNELFDKFIASHGEASVLKGQIKNVLDYGVFVIVAPGVCGLLHVSSIPKIQIYGRASIGQFIDVKIANIDTEVRRIRLELA